MKKRGFTLIEMVLVVGLLTTLVIGLTAIFRPMIATYQKSALQTDLKDKAQILIEQISKTMQTAKSLVSEKKSITEFKDEYGRNFLVYSIVNGQLQVWDFPGGRQKRCILQIFTTVTKWISSCPQRQKIMTAIRRR